MPNILLDEINRRIACLQSKLYETDLDGALIGQKADLLYFTGAVQDSYLYVPAQGDPMLLVKQKFESACAKSLVPVIAPLGSLKDIAGCLKEHGYELPGKLGMELDVLPTNMFLWFQTIFPLAKITDVSYLIREIRSVKSPYEIDLMRDAARLTDEVYAQVGSLIKVGMTELELAGEVEGLFRRAGHPGFLQMRGFNKEMVYGHLLSGANIAVPSCVDSPTGGTGVGPHFPQSAGFKRITLDEPVLVDYIGSFHDYLIDQTRIYIRGKLNEILMSAFRVALEIQSEIAARAVPGTLASELYSIALSMAQAEGLSAHFMGSGGSCGFIGHGIGLEVNELPILAPGFDTRLVVGNVIALEPKFIFYGLGGVGIENTFVVTEKGLVRLGSLPDDIIYL